jgi:hypothetical protein
MMTLQGDRRARCITCGAVLHTINGVVRHYGSDAACHKIMELKRDVRELRRVLKQSKNIVGSAAAALGPCPLRDARVKVYEEIESVLASTGVASGETEAKA